MHRYNGQWDNNDSEITIYISRNAFNIPFYGARDL